MCWQHRFRIMSWYAKLFLPKKSGWVRTYRVGRPFPFYISNIIELPSLEQRTTTSTTTGYFWYVHVIYPGLQMYQKYKQTLDCYLGADTDKSSHICVYKNDQPYFSDQHIWFILFLGWKLWDRIGFFPLIMQMDQAFSSCQPRTYVKIPLHVFSLIKIARRGPKPAEISDLFFVLFQSFIC